MNLQEAISRYSVPEIDLEALKGQEESFSLSMELLDGVAKTKTQNRRHSSYGYKHMIENPSSKCPSPRPPEVYLNYTYEGTFILAAIASGFERRQHSDGLTSSFNISERSLMARLREFANKYAEQDADGQSATSVTSKSQPQIQP